MWTALLRFSQLEVLKLQVHETGLEGAVDSFFSVVATIGTLRSLNLATIFCPRHPIDDVFYTLTNLQSLSLVFSRMAPARVSVCVSRLTRLTSLALKGVSIQGSIVLLHKLEHLSLRNVPLASEDLSSALIQLTKLTELRWDDRPLPPLPNHVLSQLKSLRRLTLCTRVDLDLEFFQSLASLSGLTSLDFSSKTCQAGLDNFRKQFTVLTQLQELELFCRRPTFNVVRLFGKGTFPRLRRLGILHPKLEKSVERMVFSRFKCLRSFKTT